jgi:Ca2+-binding RTX toxin-like protein
MSTISGTITSNSDTILCDAEDDLIDALAGNDQVQGDGGNDTLLGNAGNDTLEGGEGDDSLEGGTGVDSLVGGEGNDTLVGVGTLSGGDGNDLLITLAVRNSIALLIGGDGNDTLMGVTNSSSNPFIPDTLDGGSGDDVLIDASGANLLMGGEGNDTLTGSGRLSGDQGDDFIIGIKNVVSAYNLGATLSGDAGNDTLIGTTFKDTLLGGEGDDILQSTFAATRFAGPEINDSVDGGEGSDTLIAVIPNLAVKSLYWGNGNGRIFTPSLDGISYTGIERLNLTTGVQNDSLVGTSGNDTLKAGSGDDTLEGGNGQDQLLGGNGADSLCGGAESDQLRGGTDADTFVFGAPELAFSSLGRDTLLDFAAEEDTFSLSQATFNLANTGTLGEQFAAAPTNSDASRSEALIVYNYNSGLLFYNQNGRASGWGTGAAFAMVKGLPDLFEGHFKVVD